jgi:hypothetical protein
MKKGQAAMEFLMTYGWAILVVITAVGTLAYFGLLNPSNLVSDVCQSTPGMICIDKPFLDSDLNQVNFAMRNAFPEIVEIKDVEAGSNNECGVISNVILIEEDDTEHTLIDNNVTINPGKVFRIKLDCGNDLDGLVKTDFRIIYDSTKSTLEHSTYVSIIAKA